MRFIAPVKCWRQIVPHSSSCLLVIPASSSLPQTKPRCVLCWNSLTFLHRFFWRLIPAQTFAVNPRHNQVHTGPRQTVASGCTRYSWPPEPEDLPSLAFVLECECDDDDDEGGDDATRGFVYRSSFAGQNVCRIYTQSHVRVCGDVCFSAPELSRRTNNMLWNWGCGVKHFRVGTYLPESFGTSRVRFGFRSRWKPSRIGYRSPGK